MIKLAQGTTASPANDLGIIFTRGNGSSSNIANRAILWDESADQFVFAVTSGEDGTTSGNVTLDSYANIQAGVVTTTGNVVLGEDATIIFEGATDDASETTLQITDPTADRTITLPNLTGTVSLLTATETLTNKTLTSPTLTSAVLNTAVSGSAILDEDNMASDSNTQLATQQSIKAFVEAQVTAEDLDITTDSGTIAIDLDSETLTIAGGTGIDTTGSSNTITVAIDSTVATLTGSQTLTNKVLTSPTINTPTITNLTATNTAIRTLVGEKLPLAGGTMTGAIDMGSNNITTTGKILFANMYAAESDLPSATRPNAHRLRTTSQRSRLDAWRALRLATTRCIG